MKSTILAIRVFFFLLAISAGWLIAYTVPEWDAYRILAVFIAGLIAALVILVDMLLKGFSLRGLSAISFGLFMGWACAHLINNSPFFDFPFDNSPLGQQLTQNVYLARLTLYIVLMYLGAVIALRGRDEFNLVIPYIRFVPHNVDVPLALVDTSALIDGRIVGICESRFMGYALVIPQFVVAELQHVADSPDASRKERGRRGLEALKRLKEMEHLDLRINDSTVSNRQTVDSKLIFLAQSLKAKLLTTDFNLAQVAEFNNVEWLNLQALAKALNPSYGVGETLTVHLIKKGKEPGQAVGYLGDGSMVVVPQGTKWIGQRIDVTVDSVIPSAGGKMVFASPHQPS